MRRNSYSSPVSSRTSPASPSTNEGPIAPASTSSELETTARDHNETQRSLEQASVAIEAAYRRIRQVRRNLLLVTDNAPSPNPQTHSTESSHVGPDHNAIILHPVMQDQLTFDSEEELEAIYLQERSLMRERNRFRDLPPLNTPAVPYLPYLTPPNAVTRPNLTLPLPRHNTESPNSRRSDSEMDDATTTLGRRVAAREAAGAANISQTTAASNSPSHIPPFMTPLEHGIGSFRTSAQQRRLESSLQTYRTLVGERHSEPVPTTTPDVAVAAARLSRATDPIRRGSDAYGTPAGSGSSPASSHWEQRRRRPNVFSSRPQTSTPSERLSLLSNFSVQNLPTPVSAGASRPLIFEEPSSYLPGSERRSVHDPWEEAVAEPEHRSYVIRRRYNADGEEHVHPITLDWDEPPPWLGNIVPRDSEYRPQEPGQPLQDGSMPAFSRRRRAWARLDLDGNEIPSDEEDELERIRTEYRLQASYVPQAGNPVDPGFHYLQPITTSTSLLPEEEVNFRAGVPRVHLNTRISRDVGEPCMSPSEYNHPEQTILSPVSPFCSNPLPMPIEEMVWYPPKRRPRVVTVSKFADFAGR